nr:transposase [Sinorhizobium meliloti]
MRFRWKDYRHGDRQKVHDSLGRRIHPTLPAACLPEGFHRIRYYGFLGNRDRAQKLAHCRDLLGMPVPEPSQSQTPKEYRDRYTVLTGHSLRQCPSCHRGQMITIEVFDGTSGPLRHWDTS